MIKIRYIILLSFYFFVLKNTEAQSDYKLAEQDSLALVAFYNATDGPNWISNQEGFGFDDLSSEWQETYDGKFNNWFDGPVKDWFGVRVEKRPIPNAVDSIYRVTWLWPVIGRRTDGQNRLNGYVPREVGLLTALEQFRVNGNDGFREELIPDELYHKSLQHFDTEAAWFGGGLSDALRNCTDIRKLNVRYNLYDYTPNLDFLSPEGVRNLAGTQWFYNSRFSYFYMERIVEFFYSISPNPMEFGLEARDMFDVGDEIEIVAPLGSSVEMVCNDAGTKEEFITYQWFRNGLSRFGRDDKTYSISSVKQSDYGHYTTRITNDYVKSYDTNGNYGEVFTKGVHVVAEPVAPEILKSVVDNSGQFIDLYLSKTMADASGFSNLNIQAGNRSIEVEDAIVMGRIDRQVRVLLTSPILEDEDVVINYSSETIMDQNGGILAPLTDFQVENRARVSPQIVTAETTTDGTGIIVEFDYYIDPSSLDNTSFSISADNDYQVTSLVLNNGDVDRLISKKLFLTLDNAVSDTSEVVLIKYDSGKLHGLYGGSVLPSNFISVENNVELDRTTVLLQFVDGTAEMNDVLIDASWRATPVQLFDDGTNGDLISEDNTWSRLVFLADDTYKWDVLSRKVINSIDTISGVDTAGNIVLTLVPVAANKDSILNANYVLEFEVSEKVVTGDTIYGISNRDVVFNVQVDAQGDDIYLMGIDNDWNSGLLMTPIDQNTYTLTIPKKSAGDFIMYNYRRGTTWENETPDTRNYTVKNGENIINDNFGIFTSTDNLDFPSIRIYPNPSIDGIITIDGLTDNNKLELFNGIGQVVIKYGDFKQDKISLNLTRIPQGIYYLKAHSKAGHYKTYKIILQ